MTLFAKDHDLAIFRLDPGVFLFDFFLQKKHHRTGTFQKTDISVGYQCIGGWRFAVGAYQDRGSYRYLVQLAAVYYPESFFFQAVKFLVVMNDGSQRIHGFVLIHCLFGTPDGSYHPGTEPRSFIYFNLISHLSSSSFLNHSICSSTVIFPLSSKTASGAFISGCTSRLESS